MARKNYFDYQIERFGESFLSRKNPQNLQQDAMRIFKDMAYGNIDVRQYECYFRDQQLLESMLLEADRNYRFHHISYYGVEQLRSNPYFPQDEVNNVSAYHKEVSDFYGVIFNGLTNFKVSNDIEYLIITIGQIRKYRDCI